jgi:hypothetical protein
MNTLVLVFRGVMYKCHDNEAETQFIRLIDSYSADGTGDTKLQLAMSNESSCKN